MSYGRGTDEFRMGEEGIYPDADVPPDFNWAAHQAGLDAANAARTSASDNGWPTSSGGGVPFVFGVPSVDDMDDGSWFGIGLLVLVGFLLWKILLVMLLIGLVVGLFYLLWQIPEERYEAAWRWLVTHLQQGLSWTKCRAKVLHAKASAAHRAFARWHRHFIAQRRGRPLPAVERIRRR